MNYIPRLKEEYNSRVVKNLKEIFSYKSIMQVPKLQKIVLSRGVGGAVADKKLIEHAVDELTLITGQKAVATISKKDVASFKLRKGMPIGAKVISMPFILLTLSISISGKITRVGFKEEDGKKVRIAKKTNEVI